LAQEPTLTRLVLMFLFTLLVTAAATDNSTTETTDPVDDPPAGPACASMLAIMAAGEDLSSLAADCQTCIGAAVMAMAAANETDDMSGVMACAPTPQPGGCSDMDALMPIIAAAMAGGDDDDDDSSRRLRVSRRQLEAHGAMMAAFATLAPECGDYLMACMMTPEGQADGAYCFATATGMTAAELMTAAAASGLLPSDEPDADAPEAGCTLMYIGYLGSIDMSAAMAAVANVMAIDAACGSCLIAMSSAAATNTDEENSLAACACVIAYNEATGTTDPAIEAGSCAAPTTTTTTTTEEETTTTEPPAEDSESAAAVTGLAALLLAYFA